MNDEPGQNHVVTRRLRIFVPLLPLLVLVLLLFGLSHATLAKPTAQQGDNLAPNPGFEQPSPAFWHNSGSFLWLWWCRWSGSVFHGGSHSVEMGSNLNSRTSQWWSDFFTVTAGQQYDFSGWLRADGVSNQAFIILAFYTSTSEASLRAEFHSSQVAGSGDWVMVTGNAVAPPDAQYARMYCELDGRGTVWCDDVSVEPVTEKPILVVSKGDYPDPVELGQSLHYTITFSNTGNVSATQVIITDTYDTNVQFDSAWPAPKPGSSDRAWEIGTLGPHAGSSILLTVTVNITATDGLTLQNRVEMDCNETAPVSDTAMTKVTARPHLSITKSGYPDPVDPGDTLVYTITYSNIGTAVATGVDLSDTLPMSVNYESASVPPATFVSATNTLIWHDLGDLAAGANRAITVMVTVSNSAHRGDSLLNQVRISSKEGAVGTAEAHTGIRPSIISLVPENSFSVTLPGQTACYTHSVYISDTQPHTACLTTASLHDWTTYIDPPCPIYFEPGDLKKDVRACATVPADCAIISGTVDVLTLTASLVDVPGHTATASDIITVGQILTGIPVMPAYPSSPNCSGQYPQCFDFSHIITNIGNYTDTFRTYVTADCCPECWPKITRVAPASREIGPCQSFPATVQITVTQLHPTCFAAALVTSQDFPDVYTGFVDGVEFRRGEPIIESSAGKIANILDTVTFTHVITNQGNCTDAITISAVSSHGWPVTWTSPDPLPPGASAAIAVSVTVPCVMSGTIDTVTVTATSSLDPSKQDATLDEITVERRLAEPNLVITKVGSPDPVKPGKSLAYTITYTNTGYFCSATQVVITDTYDADMQFDSAYPIPKPGSDNRIWEIGTLDPQAGDFIVISMTVNSPLTNGLALQNKVEMGCAEADPVSVTATTLVTSQPVLSITMSQSSSSVEPGNKLFYTITYSNTGTAVATEIRITDTLPSGVLYESADPSPSSTDSTTNTLVWNPEPLGSPASRSILITVTAKIPLDDRSTLQNRVEIGSAQTNTTTDAVTTTITSPILEIGENDNPDPVEPGSTLVYTITYTNTGTAIARDVVITDILPMYVHYESASIMPKSIASDTNTLIWVTPTLGSQENSLIVTVTVNNPLTNGLTLQNWVEIDCAQTDPISATATTRIPYKVYLPIVLKDYYPPHWYHGFQLHGVLAVAGRTGVPKDTVYAGTYDQGVYSSTTGGETWGQKENLAREILGLAICPTDTQTAYAATWGGGVYKRVHQPGPPFWMDKNSDLPDLELNGAIVIHPNDCNRLCLGTSKRGVYCSDNGGDSWIQTQLTNKDVGSLFIVASTPYTIYAGTTQGVFYSIDGGHAWLSLGTGLPKNVQIWSVIETPAGQVYAGTKLKGLYRLAEGQWESVPIEGHTDFIIAGLEYIRDSLYVATSRNGVYRLYNTAWQSFNADLDSQSKIYQMSSTKQRLYIATSSGVWWYPLP